MNKLKKKTFLTIFIIITSFILITTFIFNVQAYKKEYDGIKTNLTRMNVVLFNPTTPPRNNDLLINELNNKMIMDYDFYTFVLNRNNTIIYQISHNENILNNRIIQKANQILFTNNTHALHIGLLYFDNLSYYFQAGSHLIVVDTSRVQQRLLSMAFVSVLLFLIFEIAIYHLTKKITTWITQPVEEMFNKQKDFIADASHELKTPLAIMMASVDCIDVTHENEKWIDNIKSESNRMKQLITRLLDLSKSEKSNPIDLASLNNLSKIIEKRTLIFEGVAFESNIFIETNIEKDIMFKCNKEDMDEVVSILLDNAIKHSYEKSIIKVNLYNEKNSIVLDIINNGDDIPDSERVKIFDRFYRSDKSRNRDSNRYGLGLAIAKNIVHNHNGEINAFSKDHLTTFRITFYKKH